MANSSIITDLKEKVVQEIIADEAFFYAIHPSDIKSVDDRDMLNGKHIFRYHQNPETLKLAGTFLTIQTHTSKYRQSNNVWIVPQLEIWVISHEEWMKVDNIPHIQDSRNDYIAKLLDQKFNGRNVLGVSPDDEKRLHLCGSLDLVRNVEGAVATHYLYRQLIFETRDLNDSLCDNDY